METFGFFQLPFATTTEPSVTAHSAKSQKPQSSPSTQSPVEEQPKGYSFSSDDIDEMAHNPVFWMMP